MFPNHLQPALQRQAIERDERQIDEDADAAQQRAIGLGRPIELAFVLPVVCVLLQPLESSFGRPEQPPGDVTGIIILGGGMDAEVNDVRGGYELNRAGDRFRLAGEIGWQRSLHRGQECINAQAGAKADARDERMQSYERNF